MEATGRGGNQADERAGEAVLAAPDYAAYLAKKRFLDDPASRHLLVDDCTPVVRDERRCDFEIVQVYSRKKKQEAKPPPKADEDVERDELTVHLEEWERQWKGDLKTHIKRIVHEIQTDPRDPGMARMLAMQNITKIHGQKLIEKIHVAMESMGESLFAVMKAQYSKIYSRGMFTTQQTITRLLSSFKIELRNALTADAVRQKVMLECMEQFYGSSEQHMSAGMTLHRFKLDAMERMFEAKSQPPHASRVSKERRFQLLLDQIDDFKWVSQSHLLSYCGLNSDESLKILRKVLLLLCRIPFLDLVPLAFKAEMAKATVLQSYHTGDVLATASKLYSFI